MPQKISKSPIAFQHNKSTKILRLKEIAVRQTHAAALSCSLSSHPLSRPISDAKPFRTNKWSKTIVNHVFLSERSQASHPKQTSQASCISLVSVSLIALQQETPVHTKNMKLSS